MDTDGFRGEKEKKKREREREREREVRGGFSVGLSVVQQPPASSRLLWSPLVIA